MGTTSTSLYAEDTNAREMDEEVRRLFPNLEEEKVCEMVHILFNDIRASLTCRKNLIMEELTECRNKDSWD